MKTAIIGFIAIILALVEWCKDVFYRYVLKIKTRINHAGLKFQKVIGEAIEQAYQSVHQAALLVKPAPAIQLCLINE